MARILIHMEEGYEGVNIEGLEELMRDIRFLLDIKGPRHPSRINDFNALTDDCLQQLVEKGHKMGDVSMAAILAILHFRGTDLLFFQGPDPFPNALNKFHSILVVGQNNPAVSPVEAAYCDEIGARKARLKQNWEARSEKGRNNVPELARVVPDAENIVFIPGRFSNYPTQFQTVVRNDWVRKLKGIAWFWGYRGTSPRELDTDITGCRIISPEMDTLKGLATTAIARSLKTAGDSDKLGLPGRLANEVKEKAAIKEMRANRGIKRKR